MVTKIGTAGADILVGTDGNDTLQGLAGNDQLTGGKGADRFGFSRTADSGVAVATRDAIHDFHQGEGDLLALLFDADAGRPGTQVPSFIGQQGFTAPGQSRFFFEGDHTVVEVNTTGNSGAELQILLDGHVGLVASDFVFARRDGALEHQVSLAVGDFAFNG